MNGFGLAPRNLGKGRFVKGHFWRTRNFLVTEEGNGKTRRLPVRQSCEYAYVELSLCINVIITTTIMAIKTENLRCDPSTPKIVSLLAVDCSSGEKGGVEISSLIRCRATSPLRLTQPRIIKCEKLEFCSNSPTPNFPAAVFKTHQRKIVAVEIIVQIQKCLRDFFLGNRNPSAFLSFFSKAMIMEQ